MNKIIVSDDVIKSVNLDDSIDLKVVEKSESFTVSSIKIKVLKDTSLKIVYDSKKESKLDIFISLMSNVSLNLDEVRFGVKNKIQYKYYLEDNSYLDVLKVYDVDSIREVDIVNLNGFNSKIDYTFKTVSKNDEKYDIMIYHNKGNTVSNIVNHGVNIENGTLTFNVTGLVDKGSKDCIINQKNQIVNLTCNRCNINPNLIIDENEVSASHSAHIGKLDDDSLFYLTSRGIDYNEAVHLLIKGFLLSKTDSDDLVKIIDKYWR